MRLGVLGGTFDPPHFAHLIMAECGREQLGLDRVLWVVSSDPPHKQGQAVLPIECRLRMVEAALADNPTFELSLVDVQRPGPHYTVDTLSILSTQYPEADLFFLLGADSFRDLPLWHASDRLIQQTKLVVMNRPGVMADMERLEAAIPGLRDSVVFEDAPLIDISSSDIRARVASGRSIRYLLPTNVETYIHTHGLYRPE